MSDESLNQRLADRAMELGCAAVGVTRAEPVADLGRFLDWLAAGHHADMSYLSRHAALRANPAEVLPAARAVVCVAVPYAAPPAAPASPSARVAPGFGGRDYHRVVKEVLSELAVVLGHTEPDDSWRVAVDTAPLLERSLAVSAGLGAVGRHTQLIVPGQGSRVFLGVLLTDRGLEPDAPTGEDPCTDCRACQDACPTGALRPEGGLDARRCLSYWTTATRAPIPPALRPRLAHRFYGCDECQRACPHNDAASPRLAAHPDLEGPLDRSLDTLHGWLVASRRALERELAGTALDWLARTTLLRTLCVALGNLRDAASVEPLTGALHDRDAVVRAHAAWALGRYDSDRARGALQQARHDEENPDVRRELEHALRAEPVG